MADKVHRLSIVGAEPQPQPVIMITLTNDQWGLQSQLSAPDTISILAQVIARVAGQMAKPQSGLVGSEPNA